MAPVAAYLVHPAHEAYVKIAVGRDYSDVPPLSGNYKGTRDRQLSVSVTIKPRD